MSYAIGIDLGGTCIKAVAVTADGQDLTRKTVPFSPGPMEWATKIRSLVQEFQERNQHQLTALGLSAPGLVAPDGRSIACLPERLLGIQGLDWTAFLNSPKPVPVLNDAQAALLGEGWLGAARGLRNVLLLTLGTGVGGAAMVDGRLLRGHIGRAGHLGHVCLDPDGPQDITNMPGSLEDAIGNCTVTSRSGGRFQSTHDLVAAHRAGDAEATAVWLQSVRALACAVAGFINLFDPEAVIIGGGIAQAGAALFEPLETFLDQYEWRPGGAKVRILAAQLGEFAGAYGAAVNGVRPRD